MKRRSLFCCMVLFVLLFVLTACSTKANEAATKETVDTVKQMDSSTMEEEDASESEDTSDTKAQKTSDVSTSESLEGQTLFIYCGAGMTKPFTEITGAFQEESGVTVEVTYANAAQSISQIKVSEEGDLFIAGSEDELVSIQEDYVTEIKKLVKHIPVIAVPEGNPKGITGLKDFANDDVSVILGDSEATPIGKIADKALSDAGILEQVSVLSRAATCPEIATAISLEQCDAGIIWKENADIDGVEVVDSTDMDSYIKTIPAASLNCSKNSEALAAFLEFLDTDTAKTIWQNYGYELVE